MARNIEYTASNWSGGIVGFGRIPLGHSDNVTSDAYPNDPSKGISFGWPYTLAAASADGTTVPWNFPNDAAELAAGYRGTGNSSAQAVGYGWEQRRTHRLSNGQVIWDVAGNLWEAVNFNETSGPGGPTTPDVFNIDNITNSVWTFNSRLLPTLPNLAPNWYELNDTSWHSPNNSSALDPQWFLPKGYFAVNSPYSGNLSNYSLGRIYTTNSPGSRVVMRGGPAADAHGGCYDGSVSGIFHACAFQHSTTPSIYRSFRYVVVPSP
jgi:hypothetical protein